MPLLKKKSFEKTSTALLRDEEEVFYCEITGEVFRDYEEFSERLFLCNSMVWTCSMTGKSNLTYLEALESEETAKKSLQEFPNELKIPILFLASKTKRSSFGEMAEDVFIYSKDRYFIGENVETSFTGNKWKESHVLQVIAPQTPQVKKTSPPKNGTTETRNFQPPANEYKYEIEHLDAEDEDVSEIMVVDSSQIRRKKSVYSREKSKLFLKQYVEPNEFGIWIIKASAMEQFGINNLKFEQIFDGPLPNFESSRKFNKVANGVNGKKVKQETLAKYLTKNGLAGDPVKKEAKAKNGVNLLEAMKKREEEFKKKKQIKEEEKLALKQKKKEENLKIAGYVKDYMKTKDDLELEDHSKLPVPTPVVAKIPNKNVGDMLMILEFVDNFSKALSTKDFFPQGFTYELLERALTEKEVAGPLIDIIQMFLTALFNAQEEESNQYRTQVEKGSDIKEEDLSETISLHEGTQFATVASRWSNQYQGLPLSKLPLYPLTVTEVLRLHLLSSGARINETGARWRYQQRGGYTSEDDPGLYLRMHEPHILKALSLHNVVQLPLDDKLKIISCLMNQLLTYADIRDIVEERLDKARQMKTDLKAAHAAERKRDITYTSDKAKLKKEFKEDQNALQEALLKLDKENDKKQVDNERKIDKYMKGSCDKQTLLGFDRAFRKYFKLQSIPGLFVNFEEDNPGVCLDVAVKHVPDLVNAEKNQIIEHIKKVYVDLNSSDKENQEVKSPAKVNGVHNSLLPEEKDKLRELLMCSADENCIIHSANAERIEWSFFHNKEDLDNLINNLNKRGNRESELQQILKNDKDCLYKFISHTPASQLNSSIEIDESLPRPKQLRKQGKDRYEDANLGFPSEMSSEDVLHNALIDNILEMEEKIYAGNLGSLHVKNRDKWRDCLTNKNYDDIDTTLIKKDDKHLRVKKENGKGSRSSTPDITEKQETKEPKEYQDPGRFLDDKIGASEHDTLTQPEYLTKAIKTLAIALAQVEQAVEPKYLKKPLGRTDITKNSDKKKEEYDVVERWEQSLIASTSFSQIFLHYGTLDSCIMWSRSALLARCRVCRRQKDSENMLLCDNCNLGHHLYCLKPKLTAIPPGDWFCHKCTLEKEKEEKLLNPEPVTPQRKRRIFKDEEVDEEESDEAEEEEESEEEEEEESAMKVDLCKLCGSGGELVCCDDCSSYYHRECVHPPLRRIPRGAWLCTSCKEHKEKKGKESEDKSGDSENKSWWQCTGFIYTQRRCAAKARNRIHDFTKSLRRLSESDDSEEEEIVQNRRSHRREDNREDLPLHNVALQELLSDVMKHDDAWPFLRPVQKFEVPDYYDVITRPMDFGTVKYKLNMGEYHEDLMVMKDAILVFENCNAYNHSEAEVYKCGERLRIYFQRKCKELGLKLPEDLMVDEDSEDEKQEEVVEPPNPKKRRTK